MTSPDSLDRSDDQVFTIVTDMLRQTLQLDTGYSLDRDTELLGNIPELDSMAVMTVLTGFEEHFDFFIDDSEVSAETFETVASLVSFVEEKLAE